jgi:hypothetical protein
VLWNYLAIDTYERLVLSRGWSLRHIHSGLAAPLSARVSKADSVSPDSLADPGYVGNCPVAGTGYIGMASYTSMLPPDCSTGHPSALAVASASDSALTIEKPPSFDAPPSAEPLEVTVVPAPKGFPISRTESPRVPNQACQALIDSSWAWAVSAIWPPAYRYRNFAIMSSSVWSASSCRPTMNDVTLTTFWQGRNRQPLSFRDVVSISRPALLGNNFPYRSNPLPLPPSLDAIGCIYEEPVPGNQLTDVPVSCGHKTIPQPSNAMPGRRSGRLRRQLGGAGSSFQTPNSTTYSRRLNDALAHGVNRVWREGHNFSLWISYKSSAATLTTTAIERVLAAGAALVAEQPFEEDGRIPGPAISQYFTPERR